MSRARRGSPAAAWLRLCLYLALAALLAAGFLFPRPVSRPRMYAAGAGLAVLALLGIHDLIRGRLQRRELHGLRAELKKFSAGVAEIEADDTAHQLSGLTEEGRRENALATARALDDRERAALGQARLSMRAADLALYWRSEPEGPLRLRASREDPPPAVEVLPGRGLLGLAVDQGEPMRVSGRQSLERQLPHAPSARAEALFVQPVWNQAHLLGLLVAHRERPEPFSADDERLCAALAVQLVELHRHARLLRRTEDERARMKSLADLSHRLSCTLEENEAASSVAHAGLALSGMDFSAVVLAEGEERPSVLQAENFPVPAGAVGGEGTLLELAVREHRRIAVQDLSGRERATPALGPGLDPPARSLLIQPLPLRCDARGAIVLFGREPREFSPDSLAALAMLGDLAAVSIHNAILYRRMEEKAVRDGLTGLYNHRWFQERIADELERADRLRTRIGLVIGDIDHFKKVNDNYGHPVGDQVLQAVARVLETSVRKTDAAARYGGEEFALILLGADEKGARELCERVRREVAKMSFRAAGREFHVTLSLGIAIYPDHARARAELIAAADHALYRAKEGGRNRTVVSSA